MALDVYKSPFQVEEQLREQAAKPYIQTKLFDEDTLKRSIISTPSVGDGMRPSAGMTMIFAMASAADSMMPWGVDVKSRDRMLRDFFPTEPWLISTVFSVSLRNASFEWDIVGSDPRKAQPRNTILEIKKVLNNSDRGKGWSHFVRKVCTDLFTQDNGAFIEIVRLADDPDAPVINLANIDSWRCTRTGDPQFPVLYQDREGREHILKYYQVATVEEFPSNIETMYNVQYSAVSRSLLAAQILRDIAIYKLEKVSGKFSRALHLVSGVPQTMIDDAMVYANVNDANRGLMRYSQPTILASLDPAHPLSHVQIDLASLPDGFNEEITLKWYVAQLAIAFGVDYQELAPLPGGNLGSSGQSEMLHQKTRGKGPAGFMALIEHIINNNQLVPRNVKFKFRDQDAQAEAEKADSRFVRGKDRSLRVKSGEIDVEASRELAVLDGDLPDHLVEGIERRDKEREESQVDLPTTLGQENSDPLTTEQITGGIESNNQRKEILEAKVTAEEVRDAKRRLAKRLLAEADEAGADS